MLRKNVFKSKCLRTFAYKIIFIKFIIRYDLPDPEVYRDFFRLNPLYTFKRLSETCTYFKGCPINKLDVAIAYDLPDLGGKYKKLLDEALHQLETNDKSDVKNS